MNIFTLDLFFSVYPWDMQLQELEAISKKEYLIAGKESFPQTEIYLSFKYFVTFNTISNLFLFLSDNGF